jgi:SAM-dependent methyltransferase
MSAYGIGFSRSAAYVGAMNDNHTQLCPSPGWAAHIQEEVLPFLATITTFGDYVLELGPGPGAATDWLRHRVRQLVAVESDTDAAGLLSARYAGTNVDVVIGDATQLEFASDSFDSVASLTMLHHVPTFWGQQLLLQEAFRVLKPGGTFFGSDSLSSNGLHHFHEGDDYNPVDPASFLVRLQAVGFQQLTISVDYDIKFAARKPEQSTSVACNGD